jgi:hypothetical protein
MKDGIPRSSEVNWSGHPHRESEIPWTARDAPSNKYANLPPYRLSARTKAWIGEFLESSYTDIGARLISDWEALVNSIKRFINCRMSYGAKLFDRRMSMILSPAHGDLNTNNVLFCLRERDPVFLIDFAMFQERGHALQDFAKLECEIKYALLDRQRGSSVVELPALDITSSQFPLWLELEDHLRWKRWAEPRKGWHAAGFVNNVNMSLELIQKVRQAAVEVQHQGAPDDDRPDFMNEYLMPLLYHTLRAITYPSLTAQPNS